MNRKKTFSDLWPILLAVLVGGLDQLSKLLIMNAFRPLEYKVIIPGFFNLVYYTNTGAAFGLLAGRQTLLRQVFFVGVAMAAILILFFAFRHFRQQGRIFGIAIGLIAGGALGNLIDRLRFGAVVDFLDFYIGSHHWPAFNVADSAITVGVALFLLGSFFSSDKIEEK